MSGSDPELQLPIALSLDSHAGPAARVPRERLASMVDTALLEYDRVNPTHAHKPNDAPPKPTLKASPWTVAAGTALAVVTGMAAARYIARSDEPSQAPTHVVAPATPGPSTASTPPAADTAEERNAADVATHAAVEHKSDSLRTPDRSRRALARGANVPEDLLQKANQQRAAGQFRRAAQTYSSVYGRFPKTQAAYVARVAAASLELEHLSNPLKARNLFEQALADRPRGALDLEARQGLSVALRDLEDRSGERQALRTLVTRHPGSPAARRAQVRLLELGGE